MRHFAPKSRKPACTLNSARLFTKNGSEARHRLLSWAISVAFISDHLSHIGFVYNYTSLQVMLSNFFYLNTALPNLDDLGKFSSVLLTAEGEFQEQGFVSFFFQRTAQKGNFES